MKKRVFIAAINALDKQYKKDIVNSEKLAEVFPESTSASFLPDNQLLTNAIIMLLQEAMGDTEPDKEGYTWIEWYCYETDFGRESFRIKAYEKDGSVIPMNNPGDLYDYLNKERNVK